MVRIQGNYAFATIFAWAKIKSVGPRAHPDIAITEELRREAGCAHMLKEEYIAEYCMRDLTEEEIDKLDKTEETETKKITRVVCNEIVPIYFSHLWTKFGVPVHRKI